MLYSMSQHSQQYNSESIVIVMLTPLIENSRHEACAPYWPRFENHSIDIPPDSSFGKSLKVTCVSVKKYGPKTPITLSPSYTESTEFFCPPSYFASPIESSTFQSNTSSSLSASSSNPKHQSPTTSPKASKTSNSQNQHHRRHSETQVTSNDVKLLPPFPHTHTIMHLTCPEDGVRKVIHHIYVDSWVDFGRPKEEVDIANLIYLANSLNHDSPSKSISTINYNQQNSSFFSPSKRTSDSPGSKDQMPLVVHCSAGVGRTGVFLAMDYLLTRSKLLLPELKVNKNIGYKYTYNQPQLKQQNDDGEKNSNIPQQHDIMANNRRMMIASSDPIYSLVSSMREQRLGMVQRLTQYKYIYEITRMKFYRKQKAILMNKK